MMHVGAALVALAVLAIPLVVAGLTAPVALGAATVADPAPAWLLPIGERVMASAFLVALAGFVLVMLGGLVEWLGGDS